MPDASYVGLEHVESDTGRLNGIGSARDVRSTANAYYKGDVLYGRLRPYLNKVFLADDSGLCSAEFAVLVPVEVSPRFLAWRLRCDDVVRYAMSFNVGVHRPRVRWSQLRKFEFLLPSREEQDRIVEAVESAMAAIAEVERAFDAAERSLALLELSAMHQVFQSRSGSRWQTRPLGDVADHALGKVLDREKNEGIPRPYLRNANVQWGRITLDDVKEMRIRDSEVERYRVRRGDLLVCEGGEPGRCAIWEHDEPMFFQNALHRIRPSEELDTSFLAVYLRYLALTGGLDVHVTGSTIKHLPGQRLARIPIPLPPLKEQRDIVHQLQRQRELLDTSRKYLEQVGKRLGAFRQSVLRQAFSGRLVPQDPADEPASELLKRIEAEKAEREAELKTARRRRRKSRPGSSAETTKGSRRPPSQSGKVGTSSD